MCVVAWESGGGGGGDTPDLEVCGQTGCNKRALDRQMDGRQEGSGSPFGGLLATYSKAEKSKE